MRLHTISSTIQVSKGYVTFLSDQSFQFFWFFTKLLFAGVILRISLERQLPYHLCQTYLPSVIIVTIAWLSMFVSPESIPGLKRQMVHVYEKLPPSHVPNIFRSCYIWYDNTTNLNRNVWSWKKQCAKGFLCDPLGCVDDRVHSLCLYLVTRIYHCGITAPCRTKAQKWKSWNGFQICVSIHVSYL